MIEGQLLEPVSPITSAKEAGLRYVTDRIPGITRERKGEKYIYRTKTGELVTDEKIIQRIEKLRIPHVWRDVWICPTATGHLQATGLDERNRKQYRYHTKWQQTRNLTKFNKMGSFGEALSALREKIEQDMRKRDFPREKVLATVVALLDSTLIRIGNKAYEKANKSYGLTTLRDRHVKMEGKELKIVFTGKKNVCHEIVLTDNRLKQIVKKCKEIPGYQLFQYIDEHGQRQPVSSEDVNAYLRENTGMDLSAKDFRTWGGSTYALKKLLADERPEGTKEIQKKLGEAVKFVAAKLGNTVAVCRKYYVHPLVLESYSSGQLSEVAATCTPEMMAKKEWLNREEQIFLHLLKTSGS